MLSLGGVQLVVPNMQGAGLMLPPAMSAQLLASALATMLVLVPRLAGNGPEASDAAVAPEVAPGEDARMRIAERTPSPPPSHVTVAAEGAPGGQALLVSAPLQIAHAGNVPHNVPPPGAPPQQESSVIPSVPPHVLALRELPVTAAQQAIVLLEALVKRRREHVHRVLESHSVPDELRDPYNLTCGLRGVTFIADVQGHSAGRGIWRHELKLFKLSTKGTRVEAPSLAMLLSKVDALSGLSLPELLASAMSATSTSPARMPTEATQAAHTAEVVLRGLRRGPPGLLVGRAVRRAPPFTTLLLVSTTYPSLQPCSGGLVLSNEPRTL
jgi:hypothetical protein